MNPAATPSPNSVDLSFALDPTGNAEREILYGQFTISEGFSQAGSAKGCTNYSMMSTRILFVNFNVIIS